MLTRVDTTVCFNLPKDENELRKFMNHKDFEKFRLVDQTTELVMYECSRWTFGLKTLDDEVINNA